MTIPPVRPNPYPGPRPFSPSESDLFFGRDNDIRDLLDQLIVDRVVLLYAPPGAGITSLINTGLITRLRIEGYRVSPIIRTTLPVPMPSSNEHYNPFLGSTLISLEEGYPIEQRLASDQLLRMALPDYLDLRDAQREPASSEMDEPLGDVLVFDQLEEMLAFALLNQGDVKDFFDQLAAALREPGRFALLALHEDQIGVLDSYRASFPNRLRSTYRLNFLDHAQALEAIKQPARRAGMLFTSHAADHLVDNLRWVKIELPGGTMEEGLGPVVSPIQLQVVCQRLWSSLPADCTAISQAEIGMIGTVDQALAGLYEEALHAVIDESGVRERALRDWFSNQLISNTETRRRVILGYGSTAGLDNRAISRLEDWHLLRRILFAGATLFELASDQYIQPILQSNRAWLMSHPNPLAQDATSWQETGKNPKYLLLDERLDEAEQWAAANPDELSPLEMEFLTASQDKARTRRPYKIVARQMAVWRLAALGLAVLWVLTLLLGYFFRR